MAKDKQNNDRDKSGNDAQDPQKDNSAEKSKDSSTDLASAKTTESAKASQPVDLGKLRKTTTTQVPKTSTIAGTTRTRVVAATAPPMDWKFSIFHLCRRYVPGFVHTYLWYQWRLSIKRPLQPFHI